ncbi:hypothetical protein [Erythrobacter sp.]|uniref:hypothetical protein n=1 Tax=Erythrobacter sp. TaxID=1042 RepID=UPI00312009C5
MKRMIIIALALIGAAVGALVLWSSDPIDACLDHGGSWDYDRDVCDFEQNHPGPNG